MKYVVYKLLNALVILVICYYLLKALYALGSKYLIDIHLFDQSLQLLYEVDAIIVPLYR